MWCLTATHHMSHDVTHDASHDVTHGPAPDGAGTLRVRLLGGFGVATGSGAVLALPGKRQRTLVAYLLLHRDTPSDRKHLAFLLWPESTERQALTNLRQLVHEVRALLPDPDRFVDAGRQLVRWRADAPCTLDVDDFAGALARAAALRDDEAVPALADAVARYAGDLLPECYDEWIEPFRRRLRDDLADALRRLVRLLEERRDYRAAVPHAERLRALAPLDESGTLTLMRLHAAAGERAAALDAYERCAALLRHELGVEPGAALRDLRARLLRAAPAGDGPPPPEAPPLPLVGRAREWRRLMRLWAAAPRDGPRCALVSGVAGIGKTRLAEELVRWADSQGAATAVSRCYGSVGGLPYATVADWLRAPALRHAVAALPDPWRAELACILPERGEAPAAPERPHPEARRRLFEAVARALAAAPHPLLLVVDDVQWADRETLEWLGWFLLTAAPGDGSSDAAGRAPRPLVAATLRSGEVPLEPRLGAILDDLARAGRLEELALEPLDPAETAALAAAAAGSALDERAARALHDESEGHPLYIVERMRTPPGGAASGGARPPLPQRVRAVSETRLARLSPAARAAVGVASVIGREFGVELLAAAGGVGEEDAASTLDELLERRLVRERGEGAYDFAHDRIREVAYEALSSARRRLLHRRVARAHIASPAGAAASASAIARHLEEGGLIEGAIPYYRSAAEHAMGIYASAEAARHLERALDLLARLPATRARLVQEIDLRTALCIALVHMEHYGARVLAEYARVRALCDRAGSEPGPPALRALALACIMRGEMAEAAEIGRRLRAAAPPADAENALLLVEAEYLLGVTAYWMGDPRTSARRLLRALRAYRPERAADHVNTYGQDAGAVCAVRLAQSLWTLGRATPAARLVRRAVAHAEAVAHPHTLAYVRQFAAWVLVDLGDEGAARREIDRAIALAEAHGLAGWAMRNEALHGYLLAREGQVERGIAAMRRAADAWARAAWRLAVPYDRALLARVCLDAGRLDEGARAVEEGMADARETGQTFWDAELLRLRAELLAARGAPAADVERLLREARATALRQHALALACRAEGSLRRLAGAGG